RPPSPTTLFPYTPLFRSYVSGLPFFTPRGRLSEAVIRAVQEKTGRAPELSTTGGTSDGRFIAPSGAQVVELGVINATIHKVNERSEEHTSELQSRANLVC